MKTLSTKASMGLLLALAASVLLAITSITSAASIFDIEFPISELGNCADKAACKTYCNNPANEAACSSFAAKYGLGDSGGSRSERAEVIATDGGPGNCAANSKNPEKSCHAYCSKRENMKTCVEYAKSRGIMSAEEIEEAEKVLKALEAGVSLPAGCADQESCKATCEDPKDIATARSCFAFAEKAGLLPEGIDAERAEATFKLIEEGKAPFKSPKDFKKCENPENDEIFEKCVKFATENNLIPQKDLEMIRKTGGKGPGGCRGQKQCDLYCAEHEDECIAFAEQHDLISPEDKARMQEGATQFKNALEQAPPAARTCIESAIGAEKLNAVLSGNGRPMRDLGEKARECFDAAWRTRDAEDKERGGREGGFGPGPMSGNFPPEVKRCLEEKLGADGLVKLGQGEPNPEMESVMRSCFESLRTMPGYSPEGRDEQGVPPMGESSPRGEFKRIEGGMMPPVPNPGEAANQFNRFRQYEGMSKEEIYKREAEMMRQEQIRRQTEEGFRTYEGMQGSYAPGSAPGQPGPLGQPEMNIYSNQPMPAGSYPMPGGNYPMPGNYSGSEGGQMMQYPPANSYIAPPGETQPYQPSIDGQAYQSPTPPTGTTEQTTSPPPPSNTVESPPPPPPSEPTSQPTSPPPTEPTAPQGRAPIRDFFANLILALFGAK